MQFRTLIKPDFFERLYCTLLAAGLFTFFACLVTWFEADPVLVYLWILTFFMPASLLGSGDRKYDSKYFTKRFDKMYGTHDPTIGWSESTPHVYRDTNNRYRHD